MRQRAFIIITAAILSAACLLPANTAARQKKMSIQVKTGQLRSTPGYFSRVVTRLDYAAKVIVLEEKGDWLKVKPDGGTTTGWIHKSALTKKRLKLSAGKTDISNTVTTDEQALAGKGFNSDVEAQFKKENKEIDFTWVDKMEKIKIPPEELKKFLEEGDIKPLNGGQSK